MLLVAGPVGVGAGATWAMVAGVVECWVGVVKKDVDVEDFGVDVDWGEGADEPVVVDCSLEDPELCESCQ